MTIVLGQTRAAHPSWRGGRFLKGGRWYLRVADDHPMANHQGHVAEYRLILAEALGRMLSRDEHVHHLDLDENNNAIENLVLVTRGEHARIHNAIRRGCGPLEAMHVVMEAA